MAKTRLEKGDKITIIPVEEFFKVLQMRNFCTNDETRRRVAEEIGGKEGIVESIEDKYAFDYFYFLPNAKEHYKLYSIPWESVDFEKLKL